MVYVRVRLDDVIVSPIGNVVSSRCLAKVRSVHCFVSIMIAYLARSPVN